MTLDDLEIFIAVCQAKNLSVVARQLGCTQPAVSQHVSRLEKEVGVPLLERKARGVSMTTTGKVFYENVLEGIDSIKLAVQQVKQHREGNAGTLGISTGGTTIRHFMKNAAPRFRKRYPNVNLHFHSANSHQRCIDALRNELADLAFVTMGESIRGLEQHPVIEMPWVLVVPADDPLGERRQVSVKDLQNITYIGLNGASTSQAQLETALAVANVRLNSSTVVDDWDTAILFAGMGLGYAITPALHAHQLKKQDNVCPVPIKDLPPARFGWAVRRGKSLPKVAREFIDIFAGEMSKIKKHLPE